ncbi:MAG: hypothetical protein ACRENW_01335, partial [Thermodesulfobacteriota bacterium]
SKVVMILAGIWQAAGYPWSVRLKALIPHWLPWVRKYLVLPGNVVSSRRYAGQVEIRRSSLRARTSREGLGGSSYLP